jgi:ribosomal protein L40E
VNRRNGVASEAEQLPKSELNPLINPVLGRNLGRWAQVYFTTSPEKREQAVLELLHELENETPTDVTNSKTPPSPLESAPVNTFGVDRTANERPVVEEVTGCRSCGFRNPIANQFCGKCGLRLGDPGIDVSVDQKISSVVPRFPEPIQPRILEAEADDVQWLRDKSLTILQDCPSSGSRISKFLLLMVLIGFGVFAYLHWNEQPQHVQVPQPAKTTIPGQEANAPVPSHVTRKSSSGPVAAEPQRMVQSASLAHKEPAAALPGRQTLSRNSNDQPDPGIDSSAGTQELKLAQRFLEGKTGTRDTSEAAKLLWKAVGKQNTSAAILLSDLYMRGDGVSKNCDQARLLLVAAAKHGGSQAAEQLRRIEASGCR